MPPREENRDDGGPPDAFDEGFSYAPGIKRILWKIDRCFEDHEESRFVHYPINLLFRHCKAMNGGEAPPGWSDLHNDKDHKEKDELERRGEEYLLLLMFLHGKGMYLVEKNIYEMKAI